MTSVPRSFSQATLLENCSLLGKIMFADEEISQHIFSNEGYSFYNPRNAQETYLVIEILHSN